MGIPFYIRTTMLTLSWFPVLFVGLEHGYQPCQVSGSSMAPTFNPGTETTAKDVVLVKKFNVKKPNALKYGDVVMFRSPSNPEKLLTKRVIGIQGDLIKARDPNYPKATVLIPRNHLWVEGDNAFHSVDSNNFGPISQALVVGKVAAIIWPLLRITLDIPRWGRSLEQIDKV
ncbi:putative mitochondrial inner membrane protease subunit [Metschnikowia bicuspidata]|uniref:Mitochondrial inner membrane protease subunit n=1 Tax=Metschnikowia bicuspidata TaxID=27322 RepID=A0A4P9ZCE7_9ASCO|nr:putative mitochondrial inner membrane protease subunit [Metschnikowia bicuspidata]